MGRLSGLAVAMILLVASAASAEEVVEAWRSPFGHVRSVSVNQSDSSVWVAAGCSVMHLATDGTILSQLGGFTAPEFVSVNSVDGSCWVADRISREVMHLAEDGTELWRGGGFGFEDWTSSCLSVNVADGSCWVGSSYAAVGIRGEVVHLAQDGEELLRVGGLDPIYALSVNPTDGSCWVARAGHSATGDVLHLAEDGTELWRGEYFRSPLSLSVNPEDGSCWVGREYYEDQRRGEVVHFAEDGEELLRLRGLDLISALSANPADGSCWVGSGSEVLHLAEDGTELAWAEQFLAPKSLAVDLADNSCWVADSKRRAVVHLAEDGSELWSGSGFRYPKNLLVNPADGSCWVADAEAWSVGSVMHVAADGTVLWQGEGFQQPRIMGVYPADGSCWVREQGGGGSDAIVHLAEDGTQLLRVRALLRRFANLSVNPVDGSWWACEYSYSGDPWSPGCDVDIVHFAHDGTKLLRKGGFRWEGERPTMSVNPLDGSCWIGYRSPDIGWPYGVYHIAEDGEVLLHLEGFDALGGPSVNPVNGSCWMTQSYYNRTTQRWSGEVVLFGRAGTELARLGGFGRLGAPSLVPADHSCWVTDSQRSPEYYYEHEMVHLAGNGHELARVPAPRTGYDSSLFPRLWANPKDGSCWVGLVYGPLAYLDSGGSDIWRGEAFQLLSAVSVNPTDGSCWVADRDAGQVVHLAIPVTFGDVPYYHRALHEIEACVQAGIVSGYADGLYHPELAVTRDQMAVYIARALAGGDENVPEAGWPRSFLDVPQDHWAFDHIEYCVNNGVVGGYGLHLYHPEYEVTRDQMAVYVARSICDPTGEDGLTDYVPSDPRDFPDVPSDFWAYMHIEYCVEHGVVQGYEDGLYHPEIVVTRDQMAVHVARAFGLAGE